MRKFGRDTIKCIVDRAIQEFISDPDAFDVVTFYWKGHLVEASFKWSSLICTYFLTSFIVVYTRSSVVYNLCEDFDLSIALCE